MPEGCLLLEDVPFCHGARSAPMLEAEWPGDIPRCRSSIREPDEQPDRFPIRAGNRRSPERALHRLGRIECGAGEPIRARRFEGASKRENDSRAAAAATPFNIASSIASQLSRRGFTV